LRWGSLTEDTADTWILQALEGKDVKDLLLNVGSGGGAAAAPTAGGAAPAAAAEETKEEEKEEGTIYPSICRHPVNQANNFYSKGRVRRGYGFRSFRLERFLSFCLYLQMHGHGILSVQHLAG
jgi:hypothetical protein